MSNKEWKRVKYRWKQILCPERLPTPPPPHGPAPTLAETIEAEDSAPKEIAALALSIDAPVFHPGAYRASWPQSLVWLGGIPDELVATQVRTVLTSFWIGAPVFHPGAYRASWPKSLVWLGGIPDELVPKHMSPAMAELTIRQRAPVFGSRGEILKVVRI